MIRYGVIDTNVLVSAMLKGNSVPGLVLKHVFSGNLIPVFNDKILEEYCEVLHRKKFPFSEEDVHWGMSHIRQASNEPIMLHVAKWNEKALMLYKKVGLATFVATGIMNISEKEIMILIKQAVNNFLIQAGVPLEKVV